MILIMNNAAKLKAFNNTTMCIYFTVLIVEMYEHDATCNVWSELSNFGPNLSSLTEHIYTSFVCRLATANRK